MNQNDTTLAEEVIRALEEAEIEKYGHILTYEEYQYLVYIGEI